MAFKKAARPWEIQYTKLKSFLYFHILCKNISKYAQVCEFKMFLIANKKFDCESYQIYEQYYTDAYNI